MPDSGNGIPGTAVAVATLGAVLVYAGLRGVSPLQALRDAAGGKPPPVKGTPTAPAVITSPPSASGFTDARRGAVVSAATLYMKDQYDQLRRRQIGFSDCSSFVDKCLHKAGIKPPGDPWANTANYRASGEWQTIEAPQVEPGDIAISISHMVLITGKGGTTGVGQQKPFVNVKTGSMRDLFGSQVYVFKTYKGYSHPAAGQGGSDGGGGSW